MVRFGLSTRALCVVLLLPPLLAFNAFAFSTDEVWLAVAGVGFSLIALVIVVFSRSQVDRMNRSIQQLTDALDELSRGEGGAQVPAASPGAMGDLVEAFNLASLKMRSSLEEAERSQREFSRAVARLGDTLAATHNFARILEVILETAQLVLHAERAVFFSVNPARTRLEARVVVGGEPGGTLSPGTGLAGAVVARSRPLLFPGDAEPAAPEPVCSTALAVPFFSQGVVFGVVAAYGRDDGSLFRHSDFETLEALVRQGETAVDNVFLHEEAQRLSITDGLTGLWNRRQLDLRLRQELERAARFDRSVSLIVCDIDQFKNVNDTMGHLGGDAVLVEVAQRLTTATREIDTVARYGGEEFVLVLPETDLDGASVLAEKIRRAMAGTPFEIDGQMVDVTLSFGVAVYPIHGVTARELLASADAGLYEAKDGGRNRVQVAEQATLPKADRTADEPSGRYAS